MNKQERITRGLRLIDDAQFVYDAFIPVADSNDHWNIVVFEAYRASELLIKGIIYASGYEHDETHELDNLVARFCEILDKNKEKMAFVSSISTPDGNRYFFRFIEGRVELLKLVHGSYTQLGSSTTLPNPYVAPKLRRDGISISIIQENTTVLSSSDSSLTGNYSYERQIPTPPHEDRVKMLREIVDVLRKTREEAFYSEREFSAEEGKKAIDNLNSVFQLSRAFEVAERIDNT